MACEAPKKLWVNWFWDAYILPWVGIERFLKEYLVSVAYSS
jgi:hypothetical protein